MAKTKAFTLNSHHRKW